MSPASCQLLGQLGQPVERVGRVVPQVPADLVQVDLGQGGRRVGRAQEALEVVEVAQSTGGVGRLPHAHGLVTTEAEPLVPAGTGKGLLQVAGQPVHLPTQVEVLEQRFGQALELGPLFGRHGVPHGLGGGHPGGQLLEQLVEVLRVTGEQVAVTAP